MLKSLLALRENSDGPRQLPCGTLNLRLKLLDIDALGSVRKVRFNRLKFQNQTRCDLRESDGPRYQTRRLN